MRRGWFDRLTINILSLSKDDGLTMNILSLSKDGRFTMNILSLPKDDKRTTVALRTLLQIASRSRTAH